VERRCLIWSCSSTSYTSLFMNGVPLSLMSLYGMPKRVIMCSRIKFATAALVAFRSGMASTYFVKYSVATRIQMYPLEAGLMGTIRSSPQVWNGQGVAMFWRLVW
jgi:hypothetical protein